MFPAARALADADVESLHLGGAEPSTVFGPFTLVIEIDRLIPLIVDPPDRLVEPAWSANSDLVERVQTALNELEKFIPLGEDSVPAYAHRDAAELADQVARPERYTRAGIRETRQASDAVMQRIARDGPRIFGADPMLNRATPPRGRVNKDTSAAHRAWLGRGRTGAGRLDVVTTDADELAIEGARWTAARLEGVWLRRAKLPAIELSETELIDVALDGATLSGATLHGSDLEGCTFVGGDLQRAAFIGARVRGGSFERAQLQRTDWEGAVLVQVNLRGARFGHARLRGAKLVRCDLRGADLDGIDLGGAQLVECAFAGAYGTPASIEGCSVVAADFSLAADGSKRGQVDVLLTEIAD